MKKNVQTTTETKTTVTTVTTTTTESPVNYMPITPSQEPDAEQFYKDNGIKVRKMNKFGKYRTYAIIPVDGYEEASDEEKEELATALKLPKDALAGQLTRDMLEGD